MSAPNLEAASIAKLQHHGLVYTVSLVTGECDVATLEEYLTQQHLGFQGFADPMWAEAYSIRIKAVLLEIS